MDNPLRDFVKSVLHQTFSSKSPMQIDRAKRQDLAQEIRQRLSHLSYIEADKSYLHPHSYRPPSHIFSFAIKLPVDFDLLRMHFSQFVLVRTAKNEVELLYDDMSLKVSSLDEIVVLATACQQFAETRHAEANKRKKIRHLKKQAILAHIKKLAKEDGFTFATFFGETDEMTLYVQVGYNDMLSLKLPFEKFPEMLPLIQPAIRTMRTLYEMGLTFGMGKHREIDWLESKWVTPESVWYNKAGCKEL